MKFNAEPQRNDWRIIPPGLYVTDYYKSLVPAVRIVNITRRFSLHITIKAHAARHHAHTTPAVNAGCKKRGICVDCKQKTSRKREYERFQTTEIVLSDFLDRVMGAFRLLRPARDHGRLPGQTTGYVGSGFHYVVLLLQCAGVWPCGYRRLAGR